MLILHRCILKMNRNRLQVHPIFFEENLMGERKRLSEILEAARDMRQIFTPLFFQQETTFQDLNVKL